MGKARVATIKGTFLVPTVSKNRRMYTVENIGNAVSRMQKRLTGNDGLPLTMFPSHSTADTDNALMTIGKITKVAQEADGSATFEADIADTTAGRDMATLVDPSNPFVKGLSIRGAWMAEPKTVEAEDGKDATTASDLDVFGIDWTGRPGVEGAQITDAKLYESVGLPVYDGFIFESADGEAFFDEATEEDDHKNRNLSEVADALRNAADLLSEAGDAPGDGSKPYGNVTYADPGYQKDKKKRYPMDTAAHVRAAWAYISKAKNAGAYTAQQLARVKSKIKSAAGKFKIDISEDVTMLPLQEAMEVYEAYASMCIYNADGNISASGSADADEIQNLARRIAFAAISGINALDPDNDDDIDLTAPSGEAAPVPDDNNMEGSQVCPECSEADIPPNFMFCPQCGASLANDESSEEESEEETTNTESEEAIVADETTTTEAETTEESASTSETPAAAPAITMTADQLTALVTGAVEAAVKAATPAPVTETEPQESAEEAALKALVASIREEEKTRADNEALEAVRAAGLVPGPSGLQAGARAGQFSTPVAEAGKIPSAQELSEMSEEDYLANTYEALAAHPGWSRLMNRADAHARGF
jgi:hypothetical protein